jgi:hypothetical protein
MFANGQAEIISFGTTRTMNGRQAHYRNLIRSESVPILQDSWMLFSTQVAAPDATFDRDLPVMLAILNSLRTNDRVIAQRTNENIESRNQWFAAQQQAHKELMNAYDSQNRSWERSQTIQSRSNADFDEVIRHCSTAATDYPLSIACCNCCDRSICSIQIVI